MAYSPNVTKFFCQVHHIFVLYFVYLSHAKIVSSWMRHGSELENTRGKNRLEIGAKRNIVKTNIEG